MRGFALMQHARDLEAAWRASPSHEKDAGATDALRRTLRLPDLAAYRGIGRFPFTEWAECGPGWQGSGNVAPDTEELARLRLLEIIGPLDISKPQPVCLVDRIEEADAVRGLMVAPERFELVELCSGTDCCAQPLGFDVGYWGGNFSILCDVAIWPTWHPPADDALERLAAFVDELNEHLLFPTAERASAYREWYAAQDWSEREPETFVITEIGSVDDAARGGQGGTRTAR